TSCQIALHTITSSIQGNNGTAEDPPGLARSVRRACGEVSLTARRAGPSMTTSPILSSRTARMFRAFNQSFIISPSPVGTNLLRPSAIDCGAWEGTQCCNQLQADAINWSLPVIL